MVVEFAANNQVPAASGASPFYANSGLNQKAGFELDPDGARAQKVARHLAGIHGRLRTQMWRAQAKNIYADAHRQPAPAFEPGDKVPAIPEHTEYPDHPTMPETGQ